MPELPEVETTRRGIAPHVTGRRVTRIDVYDRRLRWPVPGDIDLRMRGANRVSRVRLAALVAAVRAVLEAAIAKGGSTLRDFAGSDGAAGYFQRDYFVYGRSGEPCRLCGDPVRQTRIG